jgi:hypothetical protein
MDALAGGRFLKGAQPRDTRLDVELARFITGRPLFAAAAVSSLNVSPFLG